MFHKLCQLILIIMFFSTSGSSHPMPRGVKCLLGSYSEHLEGYRDGFIIWKDTTKQPFGPLREGLSYQERVDNATLADQFIDIYPRGFSKKPHGDPGVYRNQMFFQKMYGKDRKEVLRNLKRVYWGFGQTKYVRMTSVNDINLRLERVVEKLRKLPPPFHKFLRPVGSFIWRPIAGTTRPSMHSYGIALDIGTDYANYWRWDTLGKQPSNYRNRIPAEIVKIFEEEGFIWGGKWLHYDTMHFEYRPELLSENCSKPMQ